MLNNVLFTGGEFLKENIETGEIVYQRGNDKNRRTWTERRDKVHMDWNDCRSELMCPNFYTNNPFPPLFAVTVTKII